MATAHTTVIFKAALPVRAATTTSVGVVVASVSAVGSRLSAALPVVQTLGAAEAYRNRPLDAGPYTFVWVDALVIKVREAGRTINVPALITVGVNADGGREVRGLQLSSEEDGAGWLAGCWLAAGWLLAGWLSCAR